MDDIVMQALRDGWRLGAGTLVRQSPAYHRAPARRLDDIRAAYADLSAVYQRDKGKKGIPLA